MSSEIIQSIKHNKHKLFEIMVYIDLYLKQVTILNNESDKVRDSVFNKMSELNYNLEFNGLFVKYTREEYKTIP